MPETGIETEPTPTTYKLDLKELEKRSKVNEDTPNPLEYAKESWKGSSVDYLTRNFTFDYFTKNFSLSRDPKSSSVVALQDKYQFMRDWNQTMGMLIKHGGKEYYVNPGDINLIGDDPSKAITRHLSGKLGIPISEAQADRIVQHFNSRSITGLEDVSIKRDESYSIIAHSPKLLSLEFDNDLNMRMSYSSTVGTKRYNDPKRTLEYASSTNFEASVDKDRKFTEASLICQYQDPNLSPFQEMIGKKDDKLVSVIDRDISMDHINIISSRSEEENPIMYKKFLNNGLQMSEFSGVPHGASELLQNTLFNPEYPKDKKILILEQTLFNPNYPEKDRGLILKKVISEKVFDKETLAELLTNSMLNYLDKTFQRKEGQELNDKEKKDIAKGLEGIIKPFKNTEKENVPELVKDLDLDKVVKYSARESEYIKKSLFRKIKIFCSKVLDSLWSSRSDNITEDKKFAKTFKQFEGAKRIQDENRFKAFMEKAEKRGEESRNRILSRRAAKSLEEKSKSR